VKVAVTATLNPVKEMPIPEEYQQHHKVFSDEEAQRFPPEREEDFPIKLRLDAPQKINCKIYPLTPKEDKSLKVYIKENLAKGYIYQHLPFPVPTITKKLHCVNVSQKSRCCISVIVGTRIHFICTSG